jgi:hypothetical protein
MTEQPLNRVCEECGQWESLIHRMDGSDPYYLHLANEDTRCHAGCAHDLDWCNAGPIGPPPPRRERPPRRTGLTP